MGLEEDAVHKCDEAGHAGSSSKDTHELRSVDCAVPHSGFKEFSHILGSFTVVCVYTDHCVGSIQAEELNSVREKGVALHKGPGMTKGKAIVDLEQNIVTAVESMQKVHYEHYRK